jgi:hypothetical protein
MKNHEHEDLLEELYPVGREAPVEAVLSQLRRDRTARKRQRRALAGAAAILTVVAIVGAMLRPQPEPSQLPVIAAIPVAKPPQIERISDEQLLTALGRPAALVTLPDGRQSLLVLVRPSALH